MNTDDHGSTSTPTDNPTDVVEHVLDHHELDINLKHELDKINTLDMDKLTSQEPQQLSTTEPSTPINPLAPPSNSTSREGSAHPTEIGEPILKTEVNDLPATTNEDDSSSSVNAYARLEFESFTFYVQTLQVILGRRSESGANSSDVDVHLGPAKAISRRHAKIFYNFATQRFELTVIGRNGAFVGDIFVESGSTVPLRNSTKVQIGQIAFSFGLPLEGKNEDNNGDSDNSENQIEIEENEAVKQLTDSISQQDPSQTPQKSQQASKQSTPRPKPKTTKASKSSATHDENNLFAHVPPEQFAAMNAQVDAAIAGLPDIPMFDAGNNTNANGKTNGAAASTTNNNLAVNSNTTLGALAQKLGGFDLTQLLNGGQLAGAHDPAFLNDPQTIEQQIQNLQGFNNTQFPNNTSQLHGLANLQQLQALQQLNSFDNLQGLNGLQPAAGLGLLQQLQALQRKQAPQQQASQPRPKRKPKREYKPEEIPEQYRQKPAHSYSHLITAALRDRLSSMPDGTQGGLSLGDIYEAIMDLFPYYRYCPSGWQNSVRHNLSSSKSFRKVSKEGKGWLWGLDEEYLAEKEKQRQRALQRQQQQALAQQQAMAEQQAREKAREQARLIQEQRDREREMEQRRVLAERAAKAAQAGVPLHQLNATMGGPLRFGDTTSQVASSLQSQQQQQQQQQQQSKVLPAETVKLLAGLQQHVQKELAKDGQPPLNPQLLSNALAVVIAQTTKQAGGLSSLGTVLQQPGAVQKLLTQALQLLKSTQRVPETLRTPESIASVEPMKAPKAEPKAEPQTAPNATAQEPKTDTSTETPTPASTSTTQVNTEASNPAPTTSTPTTSTPSAPPKADKSETKENKPTLEKISEILAKAEAIPDPTPEVKGMIEKLKAHKRQLELKRSAEPIEDAPNKRTA